MFDAIKRGVIHSLQQPPPDVEALRVYLLLPECSVYQKEAGHYDDIVIPFSEAILRLSAAAGKVLSEFECKIIVTLPSGRGLVIPLFSVFFFLVVTCPRPLVFARPKKYSSCLSLHSQGLLS